MTANPCPYWKSYRVAHFDSRNFRIGTVLFWLENR